MSFEFPALLQVLGEGFQHSLQRPVADPALEPAMAGVVGWVALGQVMPLGASSQDPQDAVQDLAAAAPGPSASVRSSRHVADERLEYLPLLVRQIHRCCILLVDAAYHPAMS
jgi:hypothetical protein